MRYTRRQLRAENIVAADRSVAQAAGRSATLSEMARKAPYTAVELIAANRARKLVDLLAPLAMSDVRLCAAAVAYETGRELDYISDLFTRLLTEARFGK